MSVCLSMNRFCQDNERGLAADLHSQAGSFEDSTVRPPPLSGLEVKDFFYASHGMYNFLLMVVIIFHYLKQRKWSECTRTCLPFTDLYTVSVVFNQINNRMLPV